MAKFNTKSIRTRLLVSFVMITLFLTLGISAGSIIVGYYNGRQQAIDRLDSIAARKELQITTWIQSLQDHLVLAMNEKYSIDQASYVLEFDEENKYSDYYSKAVRKQFQRNIQGSQDLVELFLLNLNGEVVLSTDQTHEGRNYKDQSFFDQGLIKASIQLFPTTETLDQDFLFVSIPVLSQEGKLIGELAGHVKPAQIFAILSYNNGLGVTGKTYLVDSSYLLLDYSLSHFQPNSSQSLELKPIHSTGIDASIKDQTNAAGIYSNYHGIEVIGVYQWLPDLQVALLTEQSLSEAFEGIYLTLLVNLGISFTGIILAAAASMPITRSIANPLIELAHIATQIAAGELDQTAPEKGIDEIGILARAFNSMTSQLRDLINGLEHRVEERTRALERRALQLETSTRASKEISSILNIDELLPRVEKLLRDAFGYYDVHVYLIDDETHRLILASDNSATSNKNKTLEIGTGSINGIVVQTRNTFLVRDVTQEPNFLFDENLPDTKSELAIPIQIGERIIGTLDVLSRELDAFRPEDVQVIKGMGDQIAIAIENARLYDSSRKLAALEERNRLGRELHDSVAQSLSGIEMRAKAVANYLERDPRLAVAEIEELRHATHDTLQEMRALIYNLRPTSLEYTGLASALEREIKNYYRSDGPMITLDAPEEHNLPVEIEQCLLRVAQEALRNAIKYAKASHIDIALRMNSETVTLLVSDDGCGFDPSLITSDYHSFGIIGMKERVELLKGSFWLVSQPGFGTRIEVGISIGQYYGTN